MSEPRNGAFTDAELLAFLNGEADEELRLAIEAALERDEALQERLQSLDDFGAALGPAFDALLTAAPSGALRQGLYEADRAQSASPQTRPLTQLALRHWPMAASIALAALTGVLIGRGRLAPPASIVEGPAEPVQRSWMMSVADYVSLYTKETFADQINPDDLRRDLLQVSQAVSLDLASDPPTLSGLTLERAELLALNGRPLVQLAYTLEDGSPIAFCIILRPGEQIPDFAQETDFKAKSARGLNAVLWDVQPYGFLVIGDRPSEELQGFATGFVNEIRTMTNADL